MSTTRRDRLISNEQNVQKSWLESNVFNIDAPTTFKKQKYLATFPYPYMNGVLHLGHAFTVSKAEFAVGYQRLKGKNALFPFGFHCTGMPIAACADKLKREIKKYGNPPVFPQPVIEDEKEEEKEKEEKKEEKKVIKKKKVASKKAVELYQWQIMRGMGIEEDEISKFQDANYWLQYFPPLAKQDLINFGLKIDFRRSFITTSVNLYYDRFIQWQFNTLKAKDMIAFGNRPCVFSPVDNQACADHDRASGEGVMPQEYVIIKLNMVTLPSKIAHLTSNNVFLAAATLRPETMYGQTNCWVLPTGEYGVYKIKDSGKDEFWICSHRSALNMSYQNLCADKGKPECVATLEGTDLIGMEIRAPLAHYSSVYVLPLFTILMDKTTGVVTSVPSDSPDDYAALMDLKNKPDLRSKYGIADHMVLPFDPVPIISTSIGLLSAPTVCTEMGIKSQNDPKLPAAKEAVYAKGFYEGILHVGKYKDLKVQDAKPLIRADMIAGGLAALYSEPESLVVSRSGCECVVAFTDQWYMKYGTTYKWHGPVKEYVEKKLETYSDQVQTKFETAVGWLKEWACSRTYGLGTLLPWDTQFLIESLSDSTIYMAYYTIAHLIQDGNLYDGEPSKQSFAPEQLSDAVFDYIFLNGPYPDTKIDKDLLFKMKNEFNYWYPLDLRVSGKDLIPNHLTMCLYNHSAIWGDEMMPKSFYTNGHVMVDNEKMSKSKGNFLTLSYCLKEWGSDATRMALADAGDSIEDSNFNRETANTAVLRLTKEADWVTEAFELIPSLRTGPMTFFDNVFACQLSECINITDASYSKMQFREALHAGFFEMVIRRDQYKVATSKIGMHVDLIRRYINAILIMLSPICPHITETLWRQYGHTDFLVNASWPESFPVDHLLLRQNTYLEHVAHEIRVKLCDAESSFNKRVLKAKEKNVEFKDTMPTKCVVSVAAKFSDWQTEVLKTCAQEFDYDTKTFKHELPKLFGEIEVLKKKIKQAMQFSSTVKLDAVLRGSDAFELSLPFNEFNLLQEHSEFISRDLIVSVSFVEQNADGVDEKDMASPGKPNIKFL